MSDNNQVNDQLPPMRDLGPETKEQRALREWFEEQNNNNITQLEEGAKNITQLVMGLYGILFAVLALADTPAYLEHPIVRVLGTLSVLTYFVALLTALETLYPWASSFQQDNLTEMQQVYQNILQQKANSLHIALWSFVGGTACLAGLIIVVMWI